MIRFARDARQFVLVVLSVLLAGCASERAPATVSPATPYSAQSVPFASPTPETQTQRTPTKSSPILVSQSTPTPGPHAFDDVDSLEILTALFPNLRFTASGENFVVNDTPTWSIWVNSRVEGHFTDLGGPELAVIVANEAPDGTVTQSEGNPPWGSFIAIFGRNGGLRVIYRGFLFPTSISPLAFTVNIERVVDYDHDDQDDLFVTTTATRQGLTTQAGFLYQWVDQRLTEIWSASLAEDNTAALNQSQYYSSSSEVRFSDIDGIGIDSILIDTTRVDYAHDDKGLVDQDQELARRFERRVYRWTGKGYAIDSAKATPMPPPPSPTRGDVGRRERPIDDS